jgi:hypothetical protein
MPVTLNALPVTVSRAAPRAAPRRSRGPARTARAPVAVRASAHAKTPESRGSLASVGRGIALGAATLSVTLAAPPSAHAMEGVFANPAVLGATCVAVCWGIPQTLGMGLLAKKEEKGREKCAEWGIDVSDVEQGNWGRIRERVKQEAIRRGEEMPKF